MSTTETKQKKPAILVMGAPGSGKGTQGKTLGVLPRFFHCACGDVFRALDTRTELGQQFLKYSKRGELVPDELTIDLWLAQLDSWTQTSSYKPDIDLLVLDGIPRNVEQAELLENHLDVHQLFHLTCPDREELARRMRKRALKDNRIDDASEEVIQNRFVTYENETKPILDYYTERLVTDINAFQPPAKVMHDILTEIFKLDIYKEMIKVTV